MLEVENLHTCFHTESGDVNAVNGLSMTLEAGKTLGIVGESGSGKSVTAYSIMQILAETGEITEGSVKYKGEDITKWSERELHNFRGSGMVPAICAWTVPDRKDPAVRDEWIKQ